MKYYPLLLLALVATNAGGDPVSPDPSPSPSTVVAANPSQAPTTSLNLWNPSRPAPSPSPANSIQIVSTDPAPDPTPAPTPKPDLLKTLADREDRPTILSDTGKEQLANLIHSLGRRGAKPLISVNCSSIPENLAESQLFGHRKGSFTGASSDQEGKFKAADGRVVFLDELGDLPLNTQAKLLRTLDQGEIEPVGATRPIRVDVKVVAATNRDLNAMIRDHTFRRDLFQRFSSIIRIPPLRQRRSDIPQLALYVLENWNARYQGQRQLAPDALAELTRHNWPGNIRELRNVIQQSAMLTTKRIIRAADLRFSHDANASPAGLIPEPEEGFNLTNFLDDLKARTIKRAMEKAEGVQAHAAKLLGWTPQALNQYFKGRQSQHD